jgi:hypothetical protein
MQTKLLVIIVAAIWLAAGSSARAGGDDHCTHGLDGFPGVTLIGHFANDFGCMTEGYKVDGVVVAKRENASKALAKAGWSDLKKREALALAWASRALDERPLISDPPPTSKLQKDGSVVVEGFRRPRVGMRPPSAGTRDEHLRVTFSSSGDATVERVND